MKDKVDFGSLRRLTPVSTQWGFDRGNPVDRYYIESFLSQNCHRIKGRVLEVKDRSYTTRFGDERVSVSDILDIDESNIEATVIADISKSGALQTDHFDTVIFTQTLQLIEDPYAAVRNIHSGLKHGGSLLLTCPGISKIQIAGPDGRWYWTFTKSSLESILTRCFAKSALDVQSFGNVFSATCFLWGLAQEEIDTRELDYNDPEYPLVLTVCAVK